MNVLVFKLVLTPVFVGTVSLLGRRWGPTVSGLLVALPLSSGPVALFIALSQGATFAASTAVGILTGVVSAASFCLVYSRLAFRLRWLRTILLGWLAFFLCTAALQNVRLPLAPLFLAVLAILYGMLRLVPDKPSRPLVRRDSRWDIPARMLIATAFVVLITELAPVLGPHLSGLLAPFPIYASIFAVFTHRAEGAAAAAHVMRGILLGLFSFSTFFVIVAALIVPLGIGLTFVLAAIVAVAMQGVLLWRANHGTAATAHASAA
jgi:uncharacterized membrane protein